MGYAAQNTGTNTDYMSKVQEYFALEAQNPDERYSYWDGEIIAMAGALKNHNVVSGNLYMLFRQQLRGKPCTAYMENVHTQIEENGKYVYPDIVMTCDERDNEDALMVKFPSIIIEVLSKGTEVVDSSLKLLAYFNIPTLKHYLLVSQFFVAVFHYYKNEEGELITRIYTNLADIVHLKRFEIKLPLSQIYEDIFLENQV
jgi:Uma2 family endonuclease